MDIILNRSILTIVIFTCLYFLKNCACEVKWTPARIKTALRKSCIVPDVIDTFPKHIVQIQYEKKDVQFGKNMTRWDTFEDPIDISYPLDGKTAYYALIMTDPDVPSREDPKDREWQHMILVNIPGTNWKKGEFLSDYIPILDCYEKAVHRYVFIVYRQPGEQRLNFTEMRLDCRPVEALRYKFSTRNFAKKYNFGEPYAINYFMSGMVKKRILKTTTTLLPTTPKEAAAEAAVPGVHIPDAYPEDDPAIPAEPFIT